jgi:hypothetical protein
VFRATLPPSSSAIRVRAHMLLLSDWPAVGQLRERRQSLMFSPTLPRS